MHTALSVVEGGTPLVYSFDELLKYHGPNAPGGVAHAFQVLGRALPLLDDGRPVERREMKIATAHGGPGVRDAFEMVTRAVTGGRYVVDPALARPDRGNTLANYVFRLSYRGHTVTVQVREGFVADEFIELVNTSGRTEADEARLVVLKQEMTDRLLAVPATEVYDVD
ncbi:hypothetical protein ERC79_02355 [Rhodococcus sp. ABRD24]|uniref:hypothetical protein n=1 Tax=Rhodococcus sp. ABRD24 TaxID=2507582 RepID=UPI001040775B|nr:hypothetical protein [Rhodococcus sp. ABRD24]QBJ98503.1 hypothetical protein ERC79_02355 [Rhodococcus sp. ABRD24]